MVNSPNLSKIAILIAVGCDNIIRTLPAELHHSVLG